MHTLLLAAVLLLQQPGESSSKDHPVDLSPPPGEAPMATSNSDVTEMKPWDPHRAAKDIEVGEYHLKDKNYRAAEARFRDALAYKAGDPLSTFRLAQSLEKQEKLAEAKDNFEAYLKLSPNGPHTDEARRSLAQIVLRLKAKSGAADKPGTAPKP